MISKSIFTALLSYAAVWDIKARIVQDRVWIAIFALGLLNFKSDSIAGALIIFIPMLILGLCTNLGGGDIKLAGACGFYHGFYAAIPGLLIACISACVLVSAFCFIRKKQIRQTTFPFVPFLSFGFILMAILN